VPPGHAEVAPRVGGGGADQADMDGKCLVPKPGFSTEFNPLDEFRDGAGIETPALMGRVNKGLEPDVGDAPRPAAISLNN